MLDKGFGPALVLMDTLETYRLERDDATHAVGGLVRYLGHQAPNRGRLCLDFASPPSYIRRFSVLPITQLRTSARNGSYIGMRVIY